MKYLIIIFITIPLLTYLNAQRPGGVKNEIFWEKAKLSLRNNNTAFINYNPAHVINQNEKVIKRNLKPLDHISLFAIFSSDKKEIGKVITGKGDISIMQDGIIAFDKKVNYKNVEDKPVFISYLTSFKRKKKDKYVVPSLILGSDSENGKSQFSEVIIFDRVLSKLEKQKVESYLSLKYGISLPLESDYLNSEGKVIFSAKENEDYRYRVTAISRDDDGGLYQKQSGNVDDEIKLSIALSDFASTNESNKVRIEDKSNLFWADDNGSLKFEKKNEIDNMLFLNRTYKLTNAGIGKQKLQLAVSFSNIENYNKNQQYFLVVSNEKNKDLEYIPLKLMENDNYMAYYNFDKEESGHDLITLARSEKLENPSYINNIQVYPNPVKVGSTINIDLLPNIQSGNLTIYNDLGQIIVKKEIDKNITRHNEIITKSGSYKLEIEYPSHREVFSIIVVD